MAQHDPHSNLSHSSATSSALSSGTNGFLGLGLAGHAEVFGDLGFAGFVRAYADADNVFFAELEELNNSDAEGGALLLQNGDELTVITAATGVEPGQAHAQHIHGFENGMEANVPTLAQDDDRDGFIELAEGLETYGPILLNLSSPQGSETGFPMPSGGSFLFAQTYDLSDPANGKFATLLDEAPLENREIVLHGLTVLEGHGDGTEGEVDGTAGYKGVLPIAAGEIEVASSPDAALAAFADTLDDFENSHVHAASEDSASPEGSTITTDSTPGAGDDGHDHVGTGDGSADDGDTGSSNGPENGDVFGQLTFAGFLQAVVNAENAYFAELEELNNSDAEGGALLLLDGDQLTVITAATGVEPGQAHAQHIHGFENGMESNVPTLAQDDDRDGFIELAEGLETYGPILLNLSSPQGSMSGFPMPSGDSFLFAQTYDLSDPANGKFATLLDEAPLENREIVLHGLTVLEGHGEGTEGEVDGSGGYKAVLPIAAGEIEAMGSTREALIAFADTLDDFDTSHVHVNDLMVG